MKPAKNAGYSGWAYIEDRDYAENPSHFTRALLLILRDLQNLFEFVEPSEEGRTAFSFRIHALLMRTCIEVEANFKAILYSNNFTKKKTNIQDYRKIDVTHHLSSFLVVLPMWNGESPVFQPFKAWHQYRGLEAKNGEAQLNWYSTYNKSKHDRQQDFKEANLGVLIEAVAGLLVLVSSQFKDVTFDAGSNGLLIEENYHPYESSIGELFRIKYPDDWDDDEIYDFDWSVLKKSSDRFGKINYDDIVS